MIDRPYTILSCGMSIDGYIDNTAEGRLLLSNDADFDRVDAVRAGSDAILVGAATIRKDNPRLTVRSPDRRVADGLCPTPMKVTVTRHAQLDPCAHFFTVGETDKLVYCPMPTAEKARLLLGERATIVDGGSSVEMASVSSDLYRRGVRRLMVEGGASVHTQFLTADLADELQLVVAPFFVGDSQAQRFVFDGRFPWNATRRATLADVERIDDVVLLRYALSERFPD